jgi:hypothetical protein
MKFLPKNCNQALKNMGLGSGIRKTPIPDPGVKKAPDPGSGSAKLLVSLLLNKLSEKNSDSQSIAGKQLIRVVASF